MVFRCSADQSFARSPDVPAEFRNVFILDSRDWLRCCEAEFDPARDLILTYDFGLKHDIEARGGAAFYVDHLLSSEEMHENNFLVYRFFREWPNDGDGQDIFEYKGVPFGFSFRLDLWNPLVFYARARLCLECLRSIKFERLFAGTRIGIVEGILADMGLSFIPVTKPLTLTSPRYYFPIHEWMKQNIRGVGLKVKARGVLSWCIGKAWTVLDRVSGAHRSRPAVLVQNYHPTRALVARLNAEGRVRVILARATKETLWFRCIPLRARSDAFASLARDLMKRFSARRTSRLVLSNGVDISAAAYRVVEEKLLERLPDVICTLESIIRYLDSNPLRLEVLIANIGEVVTLVDCVCKRRGIPSYLIVNGHLMGDFMDESKYADVINAYSTSVRDNYFRGMKNVIAIGDPRMDPYASLNLGRKGVSPAFTITVGASGHNNADLNSYVAVEFDFMYDVLEAVRRVRDKGATLKVVIKVRPNGYADQYRSFTNEYFPGLVDRIVDDVPMRDVLLETDFYISIYSQTLFEASCFGIPCVFYKKDNEVLDPPFDGKSELVTAHSIEDLIQCLNDFRDEHPRYDAFLDRSVMEKYIGPLDGHNADRNMAMIYRMAGLANCEGR